MDESGLLSAMDFLLVVISPPLPIEYKAGPQRRSERFGEERNCLLLPRIEPTFLCGPGRSVVTGKTALSQLQPMVLDITHS